MRITVDGLRVPVEPVSWQELSWEPCTPEPRLDRDVASQAGSYRAAIPAKISDMRLQLSESDAAVVDYALRSLYIFDGYVALNLVSFRGMLEPAEAIMLRAEAYFSSQLEQLKTTPKQLFWEELTPGIDSTAAAVVGNLRAMEIAQQLSHTISVENILSIHHALLHQQTAIEPEFVGQFRKQQVWIGPDNSSPLTADFIPPHHDLVASAMTDLLEFMRRDDLPLVAQCAIAHAQFETIHPFADGNGRVGRALMYLFLRHKGVVKRTTVALSGGLLLDKAEYFAALDSYRAGDAGPIIRVFARAVDSASCINNGLVHRLRGTYAFMRHWLTGVRRDATVWQLLPELIEQPVLNSVSLREKTGLSERAVLRALKTLTETGLLTEITGKSRNRIWMNRSLFDDFKYLERAMDRRIAGLF
ncbi:Fic family protein [Canibacter oris]|uniref:Fic family protein n=1 Tax=Canibacter oris TaxID=1365628 RepID=A0A840DHU7_9MICO|nr:Fic family protein [Canibacter oris]MBB4071042.1 Fic family protein [Canibacter oris]